MNTQEVQKAVQLQGESTQIPVVVTTETKVQRHSNGRWVKGRSANPSGKPNGSSTKKTERLKMLMDSALVDRWDRYLEALDNLDDKNFVQEYRQLLEFRFPKLQRLDSTNINLQAKEKEPQTIKIGETEFIIN